MYEVWYVMLEYDRPILKLKLVFESEDKAVATQWAEKYSKLYFEVRPFITLGLAMYHQGIIVPVED